VRCESKSLARTCCTDGRQAAANLKHSFTSSCTIQLEGTMNSFTSEFNVVSRDSSFNMQVNTNKVLGYLSVSRIEEREKAEKSKSKKPIPHQPSPCLGAPQKVVSVTVIYKPDCKIGRERKSSSLQMLVCVSNAVPIISPTKPMQSLITSVNNVNTGPYQLDPPQCD